MIPFITCSTYLDLDLDLDLPLGHFTFIFMKILSNFILETYVYCFILIFINLSVGVLNCSFNFL
jgi:hypothetical protein